MAKQYLRGSSREYVFDNGSSVINFSLNIENVSEMADEKGWVQLVMTKRSDVDTYGNTHVIYKNEYERKEKKAEPVEKPSKEGNELPF